MKKIFFPAFILLGFFYADATVRTVSNNPSTIGQFSTIQAAIDASSSGDTVYVHGSPNTYASFTITNKQLIIIGPGWAPNKNMPLTATVNSATITGASSSNTEIQGLIFNNSIDLSTNHPDNIRIIRNKFFGSIHLGEGATTYSGYLLEGNIFQHNSAISGNTSSTYQNFLIQNNYFYDFFSSGQIANFFNCINVIIDHNLWFGPSSGSIDCFSGNNRFLTITNNIFVRRDAANLNSFSTFNNNITFGTGTNNPWAVNNNINAGGNVENQDPQMADQVSVNGGTDNPLLDFTIAAGPANNSGSDGKDMGLLYDVTGSLNWVNSRNSRLPFIFSMNITNPTIAAGGTLNVEVEARKGN
jgi:hypothetical protein